MEGSHLNNSTQQHKGIAGVEFIALDRYCQSPQACSQLTNSLDLERLGRGAAGGCGGGGNEFKKEYFEARTRVHIVCFSSELQPRLLSLL